MSSAVEVLASVVALEAPINATQPAAGWPHYLESADDLIRWTGLAIILLAVGRWLLRGRNDPLGRTPPRPNRLAPEHVLMLTGGFLCLVWVLQSLARRLPADAELSTTAGNVAQFLGWLACLAAGAKLFEGGTRRFLLGRGRFLRRVAEGLVLFFVAMTTCDFIYLATEAVIELAGIDPASLPQHEVIKALDNGSVPAWTLWLGAVVIAPLAEECFFRGIFQTLVRNLTARPWLAVLATAAAFGVAHAGQPQAIPAIAALGLLLGTSYERSGSLVAPILLHSLFNLKTMIWEGLGAGG